MSVYWVLLHCTAALPWSRCRNWLWHSNQLLQSSLTSEKKKKDALPRTQGINLPHEALLLAHDITPRGRGLQPEPRDAQRIQCRRESGAKTAEIEAQKAAVSNKTTLLNQACETLMEYSSQLRIMDSKLNLARNAEFWFLRKEIKSATVTLYVCDSSWLCVCVCVCVFLGHARFESY